MDFPSDDQPTIDPLHPPEGDQKNEELASYEVKSSPALLLSPTREAPSPGNDAPPDMTNVSASSLANNNMLPGLSTAVSADDSPSLQPQCAPCASISPIVADGVHQPSASSNPAAISESGAPHHPNANNDDTSTILPSHSSKDSVMDDLHPHVGAEASCGGQISTPVARHLAQMVHHTTMATIIEDHPSLAMMERAKASTLSVRTNAENKTEVAVSEAKKREAEEVAGEEVTELPIKKRKTAEDPNDPAKPKTAYMFYSQWFSTAVKEANPDLSVGEVTKFVAANWNAMSNENKAVWNRMAADDKERYQREMDMYKNLNIMATEEAKLLEETETPKKEEKTAKDPNAPARPRTAYMLYSCNGARNAVREANPLMTHGEVTKVVAADWKAMSDEKKAVWNRMAADDEARYQREMDAYKNNDFVAPPAKPKTAYMLYTASGARTAVREANPYLSFGEVTKVVAADWNAMSDENKAVWNRMAAEDKARYQREMDAYKGSELEAQRLASLDENEQKMHLSDVEYAVNDERDTYLLAAANDSEYLSDRQCYVRTHLLEIFVTNKVDVAARPSQGAKKLYENQIGLRCPFCLKLQPQDRAERAVCYPSNIKHIYQGVADMQRFHFEKCAVIPPQVLATYKSLKATRTRPNYPVSTRDYWEESARDIGLVDSPHGIQIGEDGGMEQLLIQKKVETGLLEESAATTVQRHAPSPGDCASPKTKESDSLPGLSTAVSADDSPSLQEQFVPHVSNSPIEVHDVHQSSARSTAAAMSENGAPHHPNANYDTSQLKDKAKAQRDELPLVHLPTEQDKNYGQRGVTIRPSGKWQVQYYYCGESRYIGVFDSKEIAHAAYETAREILGKETSFNLEDKEAINARINVAREAVGKKKISKKKEAKRRTAAKKKISGSSSSHAIDDERETYLLATAKDSEYLSDRQCYARSHLLEIFVTNKADVTSRRGSQKLNENQIGLRCAYCVNLNPQVRAANAVCYPSNIKHIYQGVADMQRFHFENCAAIPPQVLATYKSLKATRTRPNYPVSTRDYWEESARDIGLVDSPHGIQIGEDGGMEQLLMQKKVETGLLEESAATTVQRHAPSPGDCASPKTKESDSLPGLSTAVSADDSPSLQEQFVPHVTNSSIEADNVHQSSATPNADSDTSRLKDKGKDVILSKRDANHHQEENECPQMKKRSKRVASDPNAPKYPRTAYTLYSTSFAARIAVEAAYPDLTSDGMTRALAANWNAMSDESKAAWNYMAADDKERYKREMDAYKGSELESQWVASVEENQLKMERKAAEEAAKSYSAFGTPFRK